MHLQWQIRQTMPHISIQPSSFCAEQVDLMPAILSPPSACRFVEHGNTA